VSALNITDDDNKMTTVTTSWCQNFLFDTKNSLAKNIACHKPVYITVTDMLIIDNTKCTVTTLKI